MVGASVGTLWGFGSNYVRATLDPSLRVSVGTFVGIWVRAMVGASLRTIVRLSVGAVFLGLHVEIALESDWGYGWGLLVFSFCGAKVGAMI